MGNVFSTVLAVIIISLPSVVMAKSNLYFVLDASNSMWGQVDGVAKIETAKDAFNRLISDIPDDVSVGLGAYGHREKDSCDDIDTLTGIVGKADRSQLTDAIKDIKPKGKTPIADALKLFGMTLNATQKDANNNLVLISDGVESCNGDPCAVAAELVGSNVNFKVHVVGFDISKEDRKQLECIAEKGNGRYFSADSTDGFNEAVAEVIKVASEPPPAPEPEKATQLEIFRDNFDSDELAEHWEIINPDIDSFIVENGKFTVITSQNTELKDEKVKNLFLLNQDLPKGDWTITARFDMPIQTSREQFYVGIFDGHEKWITASMFYNKPAKAKISINVEKFSGGEFTKFERKLIEDYNDGKVRGFYDEKRPFDLSLVKTGREYHAKVVSAKDGEVVYETKVLTQLRPFGKPFIGFRNYRNVAGEGTVDIDWIKIEAAE